MSSSRRDDDDPDNEIDDFDNEQDPADVVIPQQEPSRREPQQPNQSDEVTEVETNTDAGVSENPNEPEPLAAIGNGGAADGTPTGNEREVDTNLGKRSSAKKKQQPQPAADDESDPEDPKTNALLVDGKKRLLDEEDNEEKEKRRKIIIFFVILVAFIVFLILLILFFKPSEDGAARAQLDGSDAPTFSPTYSPTEPTNSPTVSTQAPTANGSVAPTISTTPFPTLFPTIAPTFAPIPNPSQISRLPCANIRVQENVTWGTYGENNFKNYSFNDVSICGDTFGGFDSDRPQRSQWSVRQGRSDCPQLTYAEGFKMCDSVGARWCTINELTSLVAQGTGCSGDRKYVYSNTDCSADGSSKPGKYMFNLGYESVKQPYYLCETDLSTLSIIRCCGDNYAS